MALIVALAINNAANCFENDKVYNYKLDGSVLSRLANENSPQNSGIHIKAGLALKKLSDSEFVVKLDSPSLAPINRVLKDDFDSSKLDYKPFESASSLDKAFKVYVENKNIKAFDSYRDESKWVSNFKRGILSFFQLRLDAQPDTEPNSAYFTASEKTVFGDCDTDYVVLSNADGGFNVTKTRNLDKCNSRFLHKFMPIDTSDCGLDEKDMREFKNTSSMFNYSLSGSKVNYVIQRVSLVENTVSAPIGRKGVLLSVDTKFTLALDAAKSEPSELTVDSSNAVRVDNLAYDPPELLNFYANVNLDDEHHLANIYSLRPNAEQVLLGFDELASELKKFTATLDASGNEKVAEQQTTRNPELFMRLVDLVGTLNVAKLEQLYAKIDEMNSEAHKKIFWDVVSIAGTNPTFVFVKKMIVEGDAPATRIKDYLTRLSFHLKSPSKVLFDEYINLCKADKIQANEDLRKLCALPLASLINQHCVKPHIKYLRMQQDGQNATAFKKAQNLCRVSTAEEYFARLVTPISSQNSLSESADQSLGEKMYNIRLAGELGVKPSFDLLSGVIKRTDEHPSLRAAAMWNLLKPAAIYSNQVQKFVIPYFYEQNESAELRIAAFYAWMYSGIKPEQLETVATKILEEPNRQVATYISSLITNFAKTNVVKCPNRLTKDAKLAEPLLEKLKSKFESRSTPDSFASISVDTQNDYEYETASLKSFIVNNETLSSANIFYGTTEYMSGRKFQPLIVSFQAQGLDRVFGRIKNLLTNKASFLDVFSLKKRENPADAKQDAGNVSDTFLSVSVSVYGRPLVFLTRDSKELKKMMSEDGTIKVPALKKFLQSLANRTVQTMMINFERMEVFNNEMGMPIASFFNDFELKTFKLNSLKFDVEPGFFKDERQGKPPTRITANVDMRNSKQVEFFAGMGPIVESSKQRFGAGFYKRKLVNVPAKISLDVNLQENKLTMKRDPINENMLYIKQYPLTFVKRYDEFKSVERKSSEIDQWLPMYNFSDPSAMKPFKLEYMTPIAVGLRAEGKHKLSDDWSMKAWREFLFSKSLSSLLFNYVFSPSGKPLEVAVSTSTTGADDNPTKELTYSLGWKHARSDGYAGGKNVSVAYNSAISGGSSSERKVTLDASYSRDGPLRKWKVAFSRPPVSGESDAANMCWIGSLDKELSVAALLKYDKLLDAQNTKSNLLFGDDCSGDKAEAAYSSKVDGRGMYELSDQFKSNIEKALGGKKSEL